VGKGLASLYPGDTLYVRGGMYVERLRRIAIRPATSLAPIVVAAYPGERPIISGLLWLRRPNYWTLDGINVTWNPANSADEHMVKFTNGVGWTFRNSEVWGAHSFAGLLVVGNVPGEPSNWTLSGNCVHDTYPSNGTNQDHNIYLNTGLASGPGVIERNIIFNASNGENIKIGSPGIDAGGSSNVSVRYNTMYNAAQNILVGRSSHDNHIYNNILGKAAKANIRGFKLTGMNNTALDNLGVGGSVFIHNDANYTGVTDMGGNELLSQLQFDGVTSCGGFHPSSVGTETRGRYAL